MINLVTFFDIVNFLALLSALIVLLVFWKRTLNTDLKFVLFVLLILLIFHSSSNVLQWSGITLVLDPFEDYTELMEPLWWGLFLYVFLRDTATRDVYESKNKYKTLFENLPQKIFQKDVNSVFVSCNENYAKDLNIKSDEIIGKTDFYFYSKDIAEKYRADDKRIMESGRTEDIEEIYIIDGNEIWVNSVKTPIKDEDGKVIGIQGIFWDITERKKVEKAFHKSYEMFSTIMDSLDAIVYVADMETYEILFVNNCTRDIFGDVLGKTCWKTFSIDQSGPCDFCTNDKLVDENGEPVGICSWEHYNENAKCWYSIRDRAIQWIDGRIVRLEIAFDITKQKEDELKRTRLLRIIESSLNEIYIFDAKTLHFIHVNEGALKNLGYTQKEMRSMTPLGVKPKMNKEGFNKRISLLLDHEEEIVEFQTVYRRADGSLYPVEVHLQLIKDVGDPVFLAIAIDITDRKAAEDKLKKYAGDLKRSNELKDMFTDILRHDLLNPAGLVKGFTEVLIEIENDEKKLHALQKIKQNNEKLINLIESAAKFAKLESTDEFEFSVKDIGTTIKDVVEDFGPILYEKQITLDFVAEGEYLANVNPIIEEVFTNLLSNAIKYSSNESRIIVDILDSGKKWKVKVTDFGEGISDDDKPNVFTRFKRVGKGSVKGTGLGLTIVKKIIELHGGEVGVEDNPAGQGSVFWVIIRKG